jgi:hypothetical protein
MTLNDVSPFTVTSGTSESAKVPPADDWERRGQREHHGAYERPRDDFCKPLPPLARRRR